MNLFYLNELNVINAVSKDFFESIHTPFLTKLAIFITDIGSPASIALYCLVLAMIMWLHKKYTHLIQFMLTIGTAALVAVMTKELLKIPRPNGGLISEIGFGFASAHAMIAVVFFTLIAYSYKNHFKSNIARSCAGTTSACLVLLVGLSRVYLGVHYMTDVLAGFLIGFIIVSISILMYEKHLRHMNLGAEPMPSGQPIQPKHD
jgi:undecaprenyl-diphosphatase